MTLYMLFAGLGILTYAGVFVAETAFAGVRSDAFSCAASCEGREVPIAGHASIMSSEQAAARDDDSAKAVAAGGKLFRERGCVGCHQPDASGVGPTLHGRFGTPVQDASCGAVTVDESYLRESILNPSANLAPGFPPVMPAFAGEITEEQLQALVAYLKSLRAVHEN